MSERKEIWTGQFFSLFDDGTIGCSDGVGYIGEETDTKGLYQALKALYEKKELSR